MARRDLILIAEENPYHLELLKALLERELPSFKIETKEEQKAYRLIFCDSVEKITSFKEKFPSSRIIVLDSLSDETRAAQAIKKGADEYFPKTKETLENLPKLFKEWGL